MFVFVILNGNGKVKTFFIKLIFFYWLGTNTRKPCVYGLAKSKRWPRLKGGIGYVQIQEGHASKGQFWYLVTNGVVPLYKVGTQLCFFYFQYRLRYVKVEFPNSECI